MPAFNSFSEQYKNPEPRGPRRYFRPVADSKSQPIACTSIGSCPTVWQASNKYVMLCRFATAPTAHNFVSQRSISDPSEFLIISLDSVCHLCVPVCVACFRRFLRCPNLPIAAAGLTSPPLVGACVMDISFTRSSIISADCAPDKLRTLQQTLFPPSWVVLHCSVYNYHFSAFSLRTLQCSRARTAIR